MTKPKRKPGGQPGNLNAQTHGFYGRSFTRARQLRLTEARALSATDLREEIAVLRERLDLLMNAEQGNIDLLRHGLNTLARLAATHYHMSGTAQDHLTVAMANILDDIERVLKGE